MSQGNWTKRIGDQYYLFNLIGTGGYAKVKQGQETKTNDKVAIKFPFDKNGKIEHRIKEIVQSFEREISILQLVNHKNIIKMRNSLRNAVIIDEKPKSSIKTCEYPIMIVEEYAEGGMLLEYARVGAFEEQYARYYFRQIMEAIQYLHQDAKIAHLDIKAQNMLLDNDFNLKIADFGLSRKIEFKNGEEQLITLGDGTPGYRCPQAELKQPYKATEADLFAAGYLLFTLVMGDYPFTRAEVSNDQYKHISSLPGSIKSNFWKIFKKAQNISNEFKDLIERMLAFEPSQRLTIEGIMDSKWYKLGVPTDSAVKEQFNRRLEDIQFQWNKQKLENKTKSFRGAKGEEDQEEEMKFQKVIKEYSDDNILTKMFYKDSPDIIIEYIEQFANKTSEEGYEELKVSIPENAYKGRIIQFDQEENEEFEAIFKILKIPDQNMFVLEFIRSCGDYLLFQTFFDKIQRYLDEKLGYVVYKNEEES